MNTRLLESVTRRYARAIEDFAELLEAGSPAQLELQRRVIAEHAITWELLVEAAATVRKRTLAPSIAPQEEPMNNRVYVFVRDGAMYECTCDADTNGGGSAGAVSTQSYWMIRRSGCEVRGPDCTGTEFSSTQRTMEFEDLAVAAVEACTKPCAGR